MSVPLALTATARVITPLIRVAIAIGSASLRAELSELLREDGRFEVVTHDSPEAQDEDVVLTDSPSAFTNSSPRSDGELPALVVLSDDNEAVAPLRTYRGGLALLAAAATAEQITAAIEAAAAGLLVLQGDHAGALAGNAAAADDPLTPREREVLHMLAAGVGNKEIAARLGISDHTAKFHVSQILSKLNAASRTEAVSIGMRRGWVPL